MMAGCSKGRQLFSRHRTPKSDDYAFRSLSCIWGSLHHLHVHIYQSETRMRPAEGQSSGRTTRSTHGCNFFPHSAFFPLASRCRTRLGMVGTLERSRRLFCHPRYKFLCIVICALYMSICECRPFSQHQNCDSIPVSGDHTVYDCRNTPTEST